MTSKLASVRKSMKIRRLRPPSCGSVCLLESPPRGASADCWPRSQGWLVGQHACAAAHVASSSLPSACELCCSSALLSNGQWRMTTTAACGGIQQQPRRQRAAACGDNMLPAACMLLCYSFHCGQEQEAIRAALSHSALPSLLVLRCSFSRTHSWLALAAWKTCQNGRLDFGTYQTRLQSSWHAASSPQVGTQRAASRPIRPARQPARVRARPPRSGGLW